MRWLLRARSTWVRLTSSPTRVQVEFNPATASRSETVRHGVAWFPPGLTRPSDGPPGGRRPSPHSGPDPGRATLRPRPVAGPDPGRGDALTGASGRAPSTPRLGAATPLRAGGHSPDTSRRRPSPARHRKARRKPTSSLVGGSRRVLGRSMDRGGRLPNVEVYILSRRKSAYGWRT
jgi:hypothetical protein